VRHQAPDRQQQDVHLGVAEEPEQVLEQDRIAAAGGVEEVGAEMAVGEQHGHGAGQHRQRGDQQEGGDQPAPAKSGIFIIVMPGRAC
jgi:hypothetical protein